VHGSDALTRSLFADDSGADRFRHLTLADLSTPTRNAMLRLARTVSAGIDTDGYLAPRLRSYGSVILWGADDGLDAFLLVDRFEEEGEQFVYLGPLFSRGGACVDLVVHFVRRLVREHHASFIYLAAEFQNPDALMMFKRLFFTTSFPHLQDGPAPPGVERIFRTYSRRLPHIGEIDLARSSTRARQTLFRPRPALEPLVRWMAARGVDFSRGDSQLILVSCDPSPAGRLRTWHDLRRGARALSDWTDYRRFVLDGFGDLAPHE
jgi:hypothetical protein